MRFVAFNILWLIGVVCAVDVAVAQDFVVPPDTVRTDTTATAPVDTPRQDTTAVALPDTTDPEAAAVVPPAAAPRPAANGGLRESVTFTAQDSIIIVLDDENGDIATLFGSSRVTYRDARLDAHAIDLLFEIDELRARGAESDTGLVGMPQFQQGSESFAGTRLAYNMRSERGRVEEARTAVQDGFVRAGVVKVTEDTTLYVSRGVYSTCECIDDPSYSLRSNRMKIVDQEWIYTGPIQLFIFNIPTPLWLPFGFLPAHEGRRSGPLPPRYGEDDRGFYLRDWGWYWAMNDYMDLQVQFGLWSRGSWSINPLYRYNTRGRFSGQLGFDFVRNRSGEPQDPDFQIYDTAALRWNHNQTINPTSSISGNVNLSSLNYMRAISEQYDDRVRQSVSSTVRYSKRWPLGGRSLNLSLTQNQNLATRSANLTLPSLSFTQSARKPFQRSGVVDRENWFERITLSYTGRLDNRFDFVPLHDTTLVQRGVEGVEWYNALFSPGDYRLATGQQTPFRVTASHSIPVSSNFSISRIPGLVRNLRINLNQSFNYTENWYTETERRELDEETGRIVSRRETGFMAVRTYNLGVSGNTTFYGTFPWRIGAFEGFRHTVRPSASFSFSPDFTSDFWGYTRTYIDAQGREVRYPIAPGGVGTKQQTISFRVDNVFETKVVSVDDDGERSEQRLKLLDVNVNSSYNFAADSLQLAPVNLTARTRLFDQFDIRMNATYSPYVRDPVTGRMTARYIFDERPWMPLRMTNMSVNVNTSLRSSARGASRPFESPRIQPGDVLGAPAGTIPTPQGAFDGAYNTMVGYADFAIPWSLDLDFSYSLSRATLASSRRAILNARFDFNLTPNWKVQGRSGYDLIQEEMVLTNLVILRDFECWQLSMNWTPFGPYQSWGFDLHVKSGHLRDILRLRQPRRDVRGRFGGRL